MAKRITKAQKDILAALYTPEGGKIDYFSVEEAESLVERGFVEQNPGMEQDGKFATRLTETGMSKHESFTPKDEPEEPVVEKSDGYVGEVEYDEGETDVVEVEPLNKEVAKELEDKPQDEPAVVYTDEEQTEANAVVVHSDFEIEKNIEVPPKPRKVRKSYKYPFEKMEVGDSFHVPATEKRPKPARTLGSTVSSAGKKLGKNFIVRSVDATDPKGPGARVFLLESPE